MAWFWHNILPDISIDTYHYQEKRLDFNKENLPASEEILNNELTEVLEPMNGAGIFLNQEIRKNSHWSVPWSDLMMTMFILFCVLYAYPSAGIKANKPVQDNDLSEFYEKSMETFRAKNFRDITSVELTSDKAVKIILPSDILFDTGCAEIKTAASGSLVAVGELIRDKGYAVTVAGHTDNVPINTDRFPSNWELSAARACEAAKFLIGETEIPPDRIQVLGYAEYRPIASNDTPEGRRANRRVEVIISKDHILENPNTINER